MKHLFCISRIAFLTAMLLAALLFVACGSPAGTPSGGSTVTLTYYEASDEDLSEIKTLTVKDGKLTFAPPTRPGYAFEGLFDAKEGGVQVVDATGHLTFAPTEDMTLWAQWSPRSYAFLFDAAEGDFVAATDAERAFTYGERISAFPIPVREGYNFLGWSDGTGLVSDAQGTPVAAKLHFNFVNYQTEADGKVHLFASWERRTLTVTLDYNDGSYQNQTTTVLYGETLSLSSLPVLDTGKRKTKGWARMTGSSTVIGEDITNVTENITLYAVWHSYKDITLWVKEDVSQTVRLFDDEGSKNMPVPEWFGYAFDGWYTSKFFPGNPTERFSYATAADTYYARWEKIHKEYVYISTAEDLKQLEGSSDRFMLVADIHNIGSIGRISSFSGELEGNGKTLYGWTYEQQSTTTIGFIAINNGTIKNLNVSGFQITNNDPDVSGTYIAGALCGVNNGRLENVCVYDSIVRIDVGSLTTAADCYARVGAVCGQNTGDVVNCSASKCTVYAYAGTQYEGAEACVGGVIGFSTGGTVSNLHVQNVSVLCTVKANVDTNIFGCWNHGRPRAYAGGMIGYSTATTLSLSADQCVDNVVSIALERGCKHSDHIDSAKGVTVGKQE